MSEPAAPPVHPAPAAGPNAPRLRTVGPFSLLRLVGKSERTMAWAVTDQRSGEDLFLVLPRQQPANAMQIRAWEDNVRRAARLNHPNLAPVVEVGSHDRWPYIAYEASRFSPLTDLFGRTGPAAADVAQWMVQGLQGLAFAHEGGVAHGDVQPYMLLLSEGGQVRCMGLEVACLSHQDHREGQPLQAQRDLAQADVLALGFVLHRALAGTPALDEPDSVKASLRLPPLGRDLVRLPWDTAQPIPEPLRVITNRATDRQERHRYRNARTLARALEGWLQAEASGAGPLAVLLDRMQTNGTLPAAPGAAARAAKLAMMERERTDELAEVVLQDLALSFELLRVVNSAQIRGVQVAGNGPVLTVRRAIAMVGMEGVRRVALGLRAWPGPMDSASAQELQKIIRTAKRAAQLAQTLRPAGYDAEVVSLLTLLQNLGRLVVQYHLPEEAAQIRRLMQPAQSLRSNDKDDPGMSQEAAAYAVLGIDIEAAGLAVARQWGLEGSVLGTIQRHPLTTPVRVAETDDEILRAVASCANEAIDALDLPAAQVTPALTRVAQRYGRSLHISLRDLQEALHLAPPAPPASSATAATRPAPLSAPELRGAAAAQGSGT